METETMQQVLVRLPSETYEALKQQAKDEDRTLAAEVRRAVRYYLEAKQLRSA
jgi:predicted DNA-binding protein